MPFLNETFATLGNRRPFHLKTLYFILANTALCLLFLVLFIEIAFRLRDLAQTFLGARAEESFELGKPLATKKRSPIQLYWIDTRSYQGVSWQEREAVLDDFFDFEREGSVFKPFVHFSLPPFKSKNLNIVRNASGFEHRSIGLNVENPSSELYVIGGSTTFGWLVADHWTLPHYLQERLKTKGIKVSNYGVPYYSWPQEFILFSQLLKAGHRPKTAVFIDGVNYAYESPMHSRELQQLWEKRQFQSKTAPFPSTLGIFRFFNWLYHQGNSNDDFTKRLNTRYEGLDFSVQVSFPQKTKASYLESKKQIEALAKAYGVKPYFVWQPSRLFHCSTEKYRTPVPAAEIERVETLYPLMHDIYDKNYLYLGDFCQSLSPNDMAFVDGVHYSPKLNEALAATIAKSFAF